jgi:hypothetical protein
MVYQDMPIIIPLLATGYLLTIYLLLMLAQWTMKNSRYAANSISDAYTPTAATEKTVQQNEVERWSLRVRDTVLFTKGEQIRLMPKVHLETSKIVSATSAKADS